MSGYIKEEDVDQEVMAKVGICVGGSEQRDQLSERTMLLSACSFRWAAYPLSKGVCKDPLGLLPLEFP